MEEEEHLAYHRRLMYVVIAILIILVGGAIFYHYIEGWRYLDSLYFSTATLTTVGYGDLAPQTDVGKMFTIFYMLAGVTIALYGLSIIAAHFVETREEEWLQRFGRIRNIRNIKIKQHLGRLREFLTHKRLKKQKG